MSSEERQQLIEDYVLDRLPSAKREEFEKVLSTDPDLKEEVEILKVAHQSIGNPKDQEFQQNLDQLSGEFFAPESSNPPRSRRNLLLFFLAILVAAFLIWKLIPSADAPTEPGQTAPATEAPQEPAPSLPPATEEEPKADRQVIIAEADNTSDERTEANDTPSSTDTETADEPTPRPSERQLAMADPANFEAHPYLAPLTGRTLRGNKTIISITTTDAGNTSFRLAGNLAVENYNQDDQYTIYFYSNKGTDYLNTNYLRMDNLVLDSGTDMGTTPAGAPVTSLNFDYRIGYDWLPGRYYYFIAEAGSQDPLVVGEITIDQ